MPDQPNGYGLSCGIKEFLLTPWWDGSNFHLQSSLGMGILPHGPYGSR